MSASAGSSSPPILQNPQSQGDWLNLARSKRDGARHLLNIRGQRTLCYETCGFAIEALLKAALMQVHQKAKWDAALDALYRTHVLKDLAKGVGATEAALQKDYPEFRAAFAVMFQWRRKVGYHPNELSYNEATGMFQACFGKKGVAAWLAQTLNLTL